MLKGFAESFNGLDFKTEPQASDREMGYFFVQGFLTIDMRLDFFAIANDFFMNCPSICKPSMRNIMTKILIFFTAKTRMMLCISQVLKETGLK